jgi:hypothetical protein
VAAAATVSEEAGAALKVTVVPPFWQTWLFRSFTGIALIAAALLAYRSRVRGIQAQKDELEKIILERTQALQKQNLDLEALYSADEKMLRADPRRRLRRWWMWPWTSCKQTKRVSLKHPAGSIRSVSRGFRLKRCAIRHCAKPAADIGRAGAGEPLSSVTLWRSAGNRAMSFNDVGRERRSLMYTDQGQEAVAFSTSARPARPS